MPKLTDLTGRQVDGWTVVSPAETVKRIRFWNVVHSCGVMAVRPHAMLTTNAVAPCPECSPATEVGITLGHHQGPGDPAHLVGTPCAEPHKTVSLGECKHQVQWRTCSVCGPAGGVLVNDKGIPSKSGLNLTGAVVKGSDGPTAAFKAAVTEAQEKVAELAARWTIPAEDSLPASWTIPTLAPCPEPDALEDAHQLVDASQGIVSWSGKAEAAAEAQDYLAVIRARITQPAKDYTGRSPGMSALGGCERKLGGLLAFGKPTSTAWRPAIGTAADEYHLGPAFEDDNARMIRLASSLVTLGPQGPQPGRWVTKAKVAAGDPKAYGILDLYDRRTQEVVDFKVSGVTKLEATRKGHVTDQYEVQLDLYGLGMTLLGYPVKTVALLVLPMGGRSCELEDASYYRRTWNPDNALAALARRDRITAMLSVADNPQTVLESLSIQEDACEYCPVLKAGLCEGVNIRQDKGLAQIGWNPTPISLPAPPPGV